MTIRRGFVLAGVIVMTLALWIGVRAAFARSHLMKARSEVVALQSSLAAGRLDRLPQQLKSIRSEAQAARDLTSDPVWSGLSHLPGLGSSLKAAQELSKVVNQVAGQVLPPLVRASDTIAPKSLRLADGALALSRLPVAAPDLGRASQVLTSARRQLGAINDSGVIPAIKNAQLSLAHSLNGLAGSLDTAYRAAQLGPTMAGADGPRRYLVIFQTPAESRGTGGLAGSYAIIDMNHGKLTTERSGSNADFKDASSPVVDLGRGFSDRYGQASSTSEWTSANWTPHFPWAAEIWAKLWQRQSGQDIDGVIAVDPIALGYLLGVTGPVTLSDGEVISAANAARWSMSDSYRLFANNQPLRKQLSAELAKRTLNKLSSSGVDLTNLLKVMGRAAGEHRLLLWSAHPAEQAIIAGTPAAGELSDAPGPYANLILRNGAGDKLDYYLHRSLNYRALSCSAQSRKVKVSFTLTDTAPKAGLPAYVTDRLDGRKVAVGQDRIYADLFLARGATLNAWNVNGKPTSARLSIERGHSVVEFDLELPIGQPQVVTADITEPPSNRPVAIPEQPLVHPLLVTSDDRC